MQPQVAIIIPMHNAADFVGETLDNILSEHTSEIEVIVVDDKSSDGSAEIVSSKADRRVTLVSG